MSLFIHFTCFHCFYLHLALIPVATFSISLNRKKKKTLKTFCDISSFPFCCFMMPIFKKSLKETEAADVKERSRREEVNKTLTCKNEGVKNILEGFLHGEHTPCAVAAGRAAASAGLRRAPPTTRRWSPPPGGPDWWGKCPRSWPPARPDVPLWSPAPSLDGQPREKRFSSAFQHRRGWNLSLSFVFF